MDSLSVSIIVRKNPLYIVLAQSHKLTRLLVLNALDKLHKNECSHKSIMRVAHQISYYQLHGVVTDLTLNPEYTSTKICMQKMGIHFFSNP
jgi:putative ribosome biogenesis GTPase RsgA